MIEYLMTRSAESKIRIAQNGRQLSLSLLGMPFGTADYRLKKLLLFHFVLKAGENVCHRCGNAIETPDELSVEHKDSWRTSVDPKLAFFDLSNVGFSHYLCNISAPSIRKRKFAGAKERYRANSKKNQETRIASTKRWRQKRREAGLPYS